MYLVRDLVEFSCVFQEEGVFCLAVMTQALQGIPTYLRKYIVSSRRVLPNRRQPTSSCRQVSSLSAP